MEFEGLALV